MKEDFKIFLADKDISEEKYGRMTDELQIKLIELFEQNKPQGKLSIQFDFMLFKHFLVLLDGCML